MIAGPSTSGVLGGGLAKRGVGERPISSPSPAKGWGKAAVAGRGTHGDSPIMCAAPIAAPACSAGPLSRQGSGERLPAPGTIPNTVIVPQSAIPVGWGMSAPIPLNPAGTIDFVSPG